jgi:endonuclease YncB( thermonuclease family)
MELAARIAAILFSLVVLGFFAWWTMPPFELKFVWHSEPSTGPKLIPAPDPPPVTKQVAPPQPAAPMGTAATQAAPAKPTPPPPTPQVKPAEKTHAAPKPEEPKAHLLAREKAEAERLASLQAKDKEAAAPKGEIKRYFRVRVRDGGTLLTDGVTIRLDGISARDAEASCKGADGKDWPCGAAARGALTRLIRARSVVCVLPKSGEQKDFAARCAVAGTDLSAWMVRQGWADPKDPSEPALAKAAEAAKTARLGIWRGAE